MKRSPLVCYKFLSPKLHSETDANHQKIIFEIGICRIQIRIVTKIVLVLLLGHWTVEQ